MTPIHQLLGLPHEVMRDAFTGRQLARMLLVTAADDVRVARIKLYDRSFTSGFMRGEKSGTGTPEGVNDEITWVGAVLDVSSDERDWLHRWVIC